VSKNGNGDVADHTLRLLREIRANMATKPDLAEVRDEIRAEIAEVRGEVAELRADVGRIETRVDVLTRVVKDSYRVLAKRVRTVEIRLGARQPR